MLWLDHSLANTGDIGNHLVNPEEVLDEIQRIAANIINPQDGELHPPQGVYETETDALSAIANYVQVHEGDLSTVSSNGLKTLLKIARSNSSASHQAQSVLHGLLSSSESSLAPLIRPIYFEMCTSK